MQSLPDKNLKILCRVCLTTSQNLVNLTDNEKFEEEGPIINVLELVTSSKVVLDDKNLPSKICGMCLSFLKIAYNFQRQFKQSQQVLNVSTEQSESVEVELIVGEKKFDLNDVVVIEDDSKEKCSFEGFLSNLGHEVSASFVKSEEIVEERRKEDEVLVEVVKNQPINENLNYHGLSIRKTALSNKVEIVDENQRIIKTVYQCQHCSEIKPTKKILETHIELKHNSETFFVCEQCGHLAKTRSQLYHHRLNHGSKKYQCPHCTKTYLTGSRLKSHMEGHKNERRFLCNVCGKRFNFHMSLRYHMKLHSDKELVCSYCGLKFRMPWGLKRHLKTHTKEKTHPCRYCGRGFCSTSERMLHERVHTGEKPYVCKYCGRRFANGTNMQTHCMGHGGAHECVLCDRTFVELKFLKMHIRKQHRNCEFTEIE